MNSQIMKEFKSIGRFLDERNDKFERIIKISRDIVIESKRIISLLHRQSRRDEAIAEAEKRFVKLRNDKFFYLARELENEDLYYFVRAYYFGLQEYIEAVSFWKYLKSGEVVSLQEIQSDLTFDSQLKKRKREMSVDQDEPSGNNNVQASPEETKEKIIFISVFVPHMDFVLGLLDLTGELMRSCVSSVAANKPEFAFQTCRFVQDFYQGMVGVQYIKSANQKLNVLRQSTLKMERCCYNLKIRDSFEIKKPASFAMLDNNKELKDHDHYDSGCE